MPIIAPIPRDERCLMQKAIHKTCDKHAVFRVNWPESRRTDTTQFGRALREVEIELICANSSQAKGRVYT